ncbi:MAG: S16 family serine protease [Actinomyces sp.]|uniref:YlbL family protein n=1 Tax=Actinomyces sp. TaxID=29317 RepID=UPI0026DB89C9|nr:S16 family serine protease [Actinomyces sp.]MDO4244224.1 S16 family serine protease [Actinomyces sp.]
MTDDLIAPAPSPGGTRGRRRPRRRTLVLAAAGVAGVVGLVVAGATVPIDKVIEAPGPTWNVLSESADGQDLLTVSGAQTYPADGALRMTTVSVSGCPGHPVTFFMLVGAWLDENQSVIDRDQVCPDSLTEEEVEQEGQAQMTSSQDAAVVAALMESGMASRMILTVAGLSGQQTAALAEGDVLESITPAGGTTTRITTYPELREILSTIPAGTTVTLGVTRDGQAVDVELTTLAPQDQDGDGQADSEGSLLGLYLSARADSEIDAEFALSDVGGPSAGAMFALGIVDELTPGDLTGGQDIAGTGTISFDGQVGAIGGIRQKMAGAAQAGSDYFLAPTSNCAEVVGHVPEGMTVAAVSTLHEAVTAVETIASQDTSALTTCESVLDAD